MPIKAKHIDPERARLAARGLWGRNGQPSTGTTASRVSRNDKRRNGSCDSSTTTSTSSSHSGRTRRGGHQKLRTIDERRESNNGSSRAAASPAFITAMRAMDVDSEASNSDPELYRAARERTARFLYADSRPCVSGIRNTKDANGSGSSGRSVTSKEEGGDMVTKNVERDPVMSSPAKRQDSKPTVGGKEVERQANGTEEKVNVDNEDDYSVSTTIPSFVPSRTVQEALKGTQGATDSEVQRDFTRLMDLFAADIQKHRQEKKKRMDNRGEKTAAHVTHDSVNGNHEPQRQPGAPKTYVAPPRTFAELQERALLQLYAATQAEDKDSFFIATDHMAEAFALAAIEATCDAFPAKNLASGADGSSSVVRTGSSGGGPSARPDGTPLTLLELVATERARCNARVAFQQRLAEGKDVSLDPNADTLLYADADFLAANAETSLHRFFLGVRCIEVLIHNQRVTEELGRFLFKHHKLFFRSLSVDRATDDTVREFPHEAFVVYEQYSRYVSTFITKLLYKNVPNFNMEEFVLALYDVNFDAEAEDVGDKEHVSMDVLSYPAWRLLQSISSFDQFSGFMDDFIAEEYGVESLEVHNNNGNKEESDMTITRGDEDHTIAFAGARGIRALLMRTRTRAKRRTTPLGDNPLGAVLSVDDDGDKNDSDLLFPRSSSATEASLLPQEQAQQRELLPAEKRSARPDSTPSSVLSPRAALCAPPRAPFVRLPASQPSSRMEFSHCSGRVPDTKKSLVYPRTEKRRPEAVPGRKLPPLTVGKAPCDEPVFSAVQSKVGFSSESSAPLVNAPKALSVPGKGAGGGGTHARGKMASTSGVAPSFSPTDVSRSHRNKSSDARRDRKSVV